jgi:hypothetical protein
VSLHQICEFPRRRFPARSADLRQLFDVNRERVEKFFFGEGWEKPKDDVPKSE